MNKALWLLALALGHPLLVHAQSDTIDLGEVPAPEEIMLDVLVVSAQGREQSLREVPITATVLTTNALALRPLADWAALGELVPGVQIQVQSPNTPGLVIRGITSDADRAYEAPRVSVYQDGVNISRNRGSVVELFDLDRVEILKGPQGTLFGRAAQIGAIHVVQEKPDLDDNTALLRVGAGGDGALLTTGVANVVLQENRWAVRLAGQWRQADGTLDNRGGPALNSLDTVALRGSLRWKAPTGTTVDIVGNYQHDTPTGTSFKSGTIAPRTGTGTSPFTTADLDLAGATGIDRTLAGVTATVQHPVGDHGVLTAIAAVREYAAQERFDADGSQLPALDFVEDTDGDLASLEVRLAIDDKTGPFSGFVGFNGLRENSAQDVRFRTDERSLYALLSPALQTNIRNLLIAQGVPPSVAGPQAAQLLPIVSPTGANGEPNLGTATLPATLARLPAPFSSLAGLPLKPTHTESYGNTGETEAVEAFVDGTWRIAPRWELTAGLRLTYEELTSTWAVAPAPLPSALAFLKYDLTDPAVLAQLSTLLATDANILARPTGLGGPSLSAGGDDWSAVGRLALQHRVGTANYLFASLANGRRPAVFDWDNDSAAVTRLSPEEVVSLEVGAKGLAWQDRLRWELAVFAHRYRNFQTTVVENLQLRATDAGRANAWGTEASVEAKLLPTLVVTAHYAWLDSTFAETGTDGRPQQYAGNQFRLTPRHSGAVALQHRQRFGNVLWTVAPSVSGRSAIFFEDDNRPAAAQALGLELRQPALWLGHLRTSVAWGNAVGYELSASVENVTDEDYLIDAGNTGLTFGTPTFVAGPGRRWLLSLAVRW